MSLVVEKKFEPRRRGRRFLPAYRLIPLAVVVLALAFFYPAWAQSPSFYFVQITDTHIGAADNLARTQKVIRAINRLPMDIACVVHTGDIYDRRIQRNARAVKEAVQVFDALKPPIFFLPGNNEIDKNTGQGVTQYEQHLGKRTHAWSHQGVTFIFACTIPLHQGDPFGAIEAKMKTAHGGPILLFHHIPSVQDFYNNRFHPGWPDNARKRWEDLVNTNHVKAVIAGHFHRDEFHWLGSVPLYVAGPVAEKYGRQAGFRIYHYDRGKISYTAQYLE